MANVSTSQSSSKAYKRVARVARRLGRLALRRITSAAIWAVKSFAIFWGLAFVASALILLRRPGLTSHLDPVAILTIAGMNLVAVSVAGGLVGLQRQHLIETYSTAVSRVASRGARWPIVIVAQAIGVVYIVAMALVSQTLATGVAATLLLAVGLALDGVVLWDLLGRFDPTALVRIQGEIAVEEMRKRAGPPNPERVIVSAQAILDLGAKAAEKGDTEVVAQAMKAWHSITACYFERQILGLVYYDQWLDWLFARCEELVMAYAPKSAGLVLPAVIDGVVNLGVQAAHYRNPINETLDEGTYHACRVLRTAVASSVTSNLSPAAEQATVGIVRIADACLSRNKVITAQEPIRALRLIGVGMPKTGASTQASIGLTQVAIQLASHHSDHLMADAAAEGAVDAIAEIVAHDKSGLGATHFLTAPAAENNVVRLCSQLSLAGDRDKRASHWTHWDSLASAAANLCFDLPTSHPDRMVRQNAVQCCEEILLALLALPYRAVRTKMVTDLFPRYVEMVLKDTEGRFHTDERLGELLVATYHQSRQMPEASAQLRELLSTGASAIAKTQPDRRRRLSPALRQVGAAAIHNGDTEMAEVMARASLPPKPSMSKQIRLPADLFEMEWGHAIPHRPGMPDMTSDTDHLKAAARDKYLDLERRIDRSDSVDQETD
jgi:hypothetical protein